MTNEEYMSYMLSLHSSQEYIRKLTTEHPELIIEKDEFRNLTDEESDIYDKWLQQDSEYTSEQLF